MHSAAQLSRYRILIFLFAVLCCAASPLAAQSYKLETFTEEEGLTNRYVYTINQDLEGFLWIGTGNGLFRYDGAEFELYRGDSSGLAENFITTSYF